MSITHALEYYKNHCEFLGYSVEEEDQFSIVCRHPRRDLLQLILLKQNIGVMAQIIYAFPKRFYNDLIPLYMYVNELNSIFLFVKAHICSFEDSPPIIVLTSVLEGEYSRQSFAIFLDNIDYDMKKFHSYPKTPDMWGN
ncbi:hypothetical protein SAMD00079811_65580 [Scytonema sp. HK-05]|nr:hypothetical protein NIES2130_25635 [Scytonema sp. HK-05]BAY48929.1 hypothetical protein SAMD00079811_65580 [Scytonema sp. HK-05]